jgi:hypothetical protein
MMQKITEAVESSPEEAFQTRAFDGVRQAEDCLMGVGGRASGLTNLVSRTTLEKAGMLACARSLVGVVSNP